jgi:hypothetical protein
MDINIRGQGSGIRDQKNLAEAKISLHVLRTPCLRPTMDEVAHFHFVTGTTLRYRSRFGCASGNDAKKRFVNVDGLAHFRRNGGGDPALRCGHHQPALSFILGQLLRRAGNVAVELRELVLLPERQAGALIFLRCEVPRKSGPVALQTVQAPALIKQFLVYLLVRFVPVLADPNLGGQRHFQLTHTTHQLGELPTNIFQFGFRHFQHQFIMYLHHHF